MKVQKTKDGKLQMKVKKSNPIVSHWSKPETEAKANRQFSTNLRNQPKDAPLVKISERKLVRSGVADWDD